MFAGKYIDTVSVKFVEIRPQLIRLKQIVSDIQALTGKECTIDAIMQKINGGDRGLAEGQRLVSRICSSYSSLRASSPRSAWRVARR